MRDAAWPARRQLADRNPSSRCPRLQGRRLSPFDNFLPYLRAGGYFPIAVFRRDLGNELRQGGNPRRPPQFDVTLGGSLDLQRIAFLQFGFLNHGLGNAHSQAVAPLHHLRLHAIRLFDNTKYIPPYLQCRYHEMLTGIYRAARGGSGAPNTIHRSVSISTLSPPNAPRQPAPPTGISSPRSPPPPWRRCARRRLRTP